MQFQENESAAHPMPPLFITFRLADSLPRQLLDDWVRARDAFLAVNPPPWDEITEACYHGPFPDKLDEHLDAAHGSCDLRDPRLAQIVADLLHHFDGQRYDLWSYVIMPNHVHVLFTLRAPFYEPHSTSNRPVARRLARDAEDHRVQARIVKATLASTDEFPTHVSLPHPPSACLVFGLHGLCPKCGLRRGRAAFVGPGGAGA
jgi:hypothetical protein